MMTKTTDEVNNKDDKDVIEVYWGKTEKDMDQSGVKASEFPSFEDFVKDFNAKDVFSDGNTHVVEEQALLDFLPAPRAIPRADDKGLLSPKWFDMEVLKLNINGKTYEVLGRVLDE